MSANAKINAILSAISIVFIVIIIRLLYLQIYCADYFVLRSQKNFIRYEMSSSPRGNICDVHGTLLATNKPIICLMWQGTGNRSLSQEQIDTLKIIGNIVQQDCLCEPLYEKIIAAERKNQKIALVSDLDFTNLGKLLELFPHHENIIIDTQFKRFYPYNNSACHVIGYVGNMHVVTAGQSGLEKVFDEDLTGKHGATCHVVNSTGQRLSYTEIEKGVSGADITTTLDMRLQELCEKVFPGHHSGTFILLNPIDGAIVALVSRPSFDPNIFLEPISFETWNALQERNPFLNRVFDASYPSGSIFKLITISAALEQNIITPDMIWDCKGYTLFGNRKYWCGRKSSHGEISVVQAVATSCNTLFFDIGKKIDIDVLAEYAHKFGLGEKTRCVLPEKSGLVPNREWKFDC